MVFEDENVFTTQDAAEKYCKEKNVFMIYVIKIKDKENIFYTRRFDKVISLLEQIGRASCRERV